MESRTSSFRRAFRGSSWLLMSTSLCPPVTALGHFETWALIDIKMLVGISILLVEYQEFRLSIKFSLLVPPIGRRASACAVMHSSITFTTRAKYLILNVFCF